MLQFQEERLAAASGALAPLQNAIDETIEYTRTRHAFGQPLLNNQYLHFRLAELQTELELFRALTYQAADAMERGEDVTLYASMLKLKCGRLSQKSLIRVFNFGEEWDILMRFISQDYTVI